MKKLTKTLSLVLVVAMVLSLCVIGASATFTDNDKITKTNNEAVALMTDMKVVGGYKDGSFKPAGTLTRAEACVLLTNMTLGPNASAVAPSTVSFKDVPTSFWGYKYIEYCYQSGYIAGTGAGKFSPNATLTGYQWALMLMRVRGVDMSNLTGANWQINTAKAYYADATSFSKVAIGNVAITREAATQMTYDALFTSLTGATGYPVYLAAGDKLVGVYSTVAEASAMCQALNAKAGLDNTYYVGTTKATMGTDYMAKTVFGVTKETKTDDFGRPSTVYTATTAAEGTTYGWTNKTKTVANLPTLTYTEKVTSGKIFTDLGLTTSTAITANTYTDGVFAAGTLSVVYKGTDSIGGNGTVTEVYYNPVTKTINIVLVNTYFGMVTKVTPATSAANAKRTVTVSALGVDTDAAGKATASAFTSGDFETENFALKDYVLYTVARTAASTYVVESAVAAKPVELTATSYSTLGFTAGGTTYKYNAMCASSTLQDFSSHKVFVDANNYVMDVADVTATPDFAVLTKLGTTTDNWGIGHPVAQLVFADGTAKQVNLDGTDYSANLNTVVRYTVTGNVYTLAAIDSTPIKGVTYTAAAEGTFKTVDSDTAVVDGGVNLAVIKGVSQFTFGDTYYANTQTIFVVRTGAGTPASPYAYTSYNGVTNVPSMSATGKAAGYVVSASGVAKLVYIVGSNVTATTTSDVVFVSGLYTTSTKQVNSVNVTYYTGSAVVNGKVETVDFAENYGIGVYTGKVTDTNGNTVLTNNVGRALASNSVYDILGNTIVNNGVTYSVAPDCAVYTYNATTGALTAVTLADVPEGATGWMTLQSDTTANSTAAVVSAIYISVP